MNDNIVIEQKTKLQNTIIDLSQAAFDLSQHMIQNSNSGQCKDEKSKLEPSQLIILKSFTNSIDSLSEIYKNIYEEDIDIVSNEIKEQNDKTNKVLKYSLLKYQEKERQRIAADLHDSVVQNLVHLSQQIEIVQRSMDTDLISSRLELASMKKNIKSIISDIRNTIFNLRPMTFDDIGWDAAFIQLKEMIETNSESSVLLEVEKPVNQDQLFLITVYRIIREACINAIKHANADEVKIKVNNDKDNICISIEDNGEGFSIDDVLQNKGNHFGLDVMRERVLLLSGNLDIISNKDNGTKIQIKIPI